MAQQKFLIVLGGPTASGKTGVAIQLAQHFKTQIISADSRQFFQEMSIGTAKPTKQERAAVEHHFVDFRSIQEAYTVGDYEREVLTFLDSWYQEHDFAIITGGSGLYIRAVCEGLDYFPEVKPEIREELNQLLANQGIQTLQTELARVDPTYYAEVDQHNPQRLIRALEVYRSSGQPFSSFRTGNKATRPFTPIYLQLAWDRELLYARINQRVDQMMDQGLLAEAQGLYPQRTINALQTVGYQELFDFFEQKHSLEEAIELIKRNSRRYAKRQLTWLRKRDAWQSFTINQVEDMIHYIEKKTSF